MRFHTCKTSFVAVRSMIADESTVDRGAKRR